MSETFLNEPDRQANSRDQTIEVARANVKTLVLYHLSIRSTAPRPSLRFARKSPPADLPAPAGCSMKGTSSK